MPVPTSYSNTRLLDQYWVRPCYPVYYKYLLETLMGTLCDLTPEDGTVYEEMKRQNPNLTEMKEKKLLSRDAIISGTPGIGKSVFYHYCVNRILKEAKAGSVPMGSTTPLFQQRKVRLFANATAKGKGGDAVFKGGWVTCDPDTQEWSKLKNTNTNLQDAAAEISDEDDVYQLVMIDGPIDSPPTIPDRARWVVFTSRNDAVKKRSFPTGATNYLYMPDWTKEELKLACAALHPQRDAALMDKTIQNRMYFFGGKPEYCLGTSTYNDILNYANDVKERLLSIPEIGKKEVSQEVEIKRDKLFRVVPKYQGGVPMDFDTDFLCPWVAVQYAKYLVTAHSDNAQAIIEACRECPDMCGGGGSLYERQVFSRLKAYKAKDKAEFTLNYLEPPGKRPRTDEQTIQLKACQMNDVVVATTNFPTVDGWSFVYALFEGSTTECLVLYQMTISNHHTVKGLGFERLLTIPAVIAWNARREADIPKLQAIEAELAALEEKAKTIPRGQKTAFARTRKATEKGLQKQKKELQATTKCLLVFVTPDEVDTFKGYQKGSDAEADDYLRDWNVKQYHMYFPIADQKHQLKLMRALADEDGSMEMM